MNDQLKMILLYDPRFFNGQPQPPVKIQYSVTMLANRILILWDGWANLFVKCNRDHVSTVMHRMCYLTKKVQYG